MTRELKYQALKVKWDPALKLCDLLSRTLNGYWRTYIWCSFHGRLYDPEVAYNFRKGKD
jgi:hypothetical protein